MLSKKTFRDITKNKAQFITIFLMSFLGVFVFSGVHAYMDGMKLSGDNYYKNNNLQDLWVYGENFTNTDLNNIKKIKNVKDAERILTVTSTLNNYKDVTLETNFIESNNISKMYIVEGEEFSKDKKGVWLDSYLAKYLKLKVNDLITFTYKNYKITEKIKGLVNTPDHVYKVKNDSEIFPTHKDFGYIYLSINEFPKEYIYNELKTKLSLTNITNSMVEQQFPNFKLSNYYVFNSIIVDLSNPKKLNTTKNAIENKISSVLAVTSRESNDSYVSYNSEIEEGNTYSSVFTCLFLFIAILSIVTTMNRFVKKQRTQIGVLKALGFRNKKIVKHYISYGFYISIISSILGVILGGLLIGKYFLQAEMAFFEIPIYNITILPIVYILALIVVILITIATYLSCRKVLKEPASEALRIEIPKVKETKFDLTTKGLFKNSSLSTRWNLRDIARNKGRTIMGVVGIIGCTMLIICALGLLDTTDSYLNWQFKTLYNFKYKISLDNNYSQSEYNDLVKKYGNSTSQTLGIELKKQNKEKETNSITINDSNNYLRYTGLNKELIKQKNNGIFITKKLANKLNLKLGDKITWHVFGSKTWYTTKIIEINRDPQNQNLNITRNYAEKLGLVYKADSMYTKKDLNKIKSLPGVKTIQSIENLKKGMESMLGVVKQLVVLLIVVSVILAFVIIYNLGVLSFSEKEYQFATLKVLGFKNRQIKQIFLKQNIWITLVAIIIGLPLGYLMTDYIFISALGDNFDLNAEINLMSYIYTSIGTFITSLVINNILSKKIKKIDMVSSLKANE